MLMNRRLSSAEQMVVSLAKIKTDLDEIGTIKVQDPNWKSVFRIADEQEVYTVVYKNAKRLGLICSEFLSEDKILRDREMHKKIYISEMEKLKRKLTDMHTYVLCLKGYSLDENIYQGLRDYKDIDIAVDKDNFGNLLHALEDLGYIGESGAIASWLRHSFFHTGEMVGEVKKIVDGVEVTFDIHKIMKKSPEHLDQIFDNAGKNGYLCVPTLFDGCVFACYHAWRHYPHPYRMVAHTHVMNLKNLMDIRELYLQIVNAEKELEFYQYANSIDSIYVVNEMLDLAERIYGKFVAEQFKFTFFNRVKHDYSDGDIFSFFEDRLFYKKEEGEKALLLGNKHLAMLQYGKKMNCEKIVDREQENLTIDDLSLPILTMTCGYWNDVYGGHSFNINTKEAMIRLYWSKIFFIGVIKVIDGEYQFGSNKYYDETQDKITLEFVRQHIILSILPKYDGNHKVYRMVGERRVPMEIKECTLHCENFQDGYKCIIMIPWNFLRINPVLWKEFILCINIVVGCATNFGKDILMPFGYSTNVQLSENEIGAQREVSI